MLKLFIKMAKITFAGLLRVGDGVILFNLSWERIFFLN